MNKTLTAFRRKIDISGLLAAAAAWVRRA